MRSKAYAISHPIRDVRQLWVYPWSNISSDSLARTLSFVLLDVYLIDCQKKKGRPGSIAELRRGFRRIEETKEGTIRVSENHWPWARIVKVFDPKENRVDFQIFLSQKGAFEDLSTTVDRLLIGFAQGYDRVKDVCYQFRDGDVAASFHIFDESGRLIPHGSYPLSLRGKYDPLLRKLVKQYPGEWADILQEAELAFFQSVMAYSEDKGFPGGYFKKSVQHRLSRNYSRSKSELDPDMKVADVEIVARPFTSDDELINETIKTEILAREDHDEVDCIILDFFEYSDREIAREVENQMGRRITKQAVQKRRARIKQILRPSLEWRIAMIEDLKNF